MKLLIVTQKVDKNDSTLGFFHGWLKEFARHCEQLTVICLEKGEYDLPDNVKILSLGKEKGESRTKYLQNFFKYIYQEKNNYEAVFVHMNPEYAVLSGLLWRAWGKKIGLWYTHKSVNFKLILAEKLAHVVFTASKESFRLKSDKLVVTGHGIDVEKLKGKSNKEKVGDKFNIVSVGRISPVKKYETLIEAVKILIGDRVRVHVKIVGGPGTPEQEDYFGSLKKKVQESGLSDVVEFVGKIPNTDIVKYLQEADLFVNLSETGSLDKAVLEAMACNVDVLTSNEAFRGMLPQECMVENNKESVAKALSKKIEQPNHIQLRSIILEKHNLTSLIERIVKRLSLPGSSAKR